MNIKINDFNIISHKDKLEIVKSYCHLYEISRLKRGLYNLYYDFYEIKETGFNPVVIKQKTKNYYVLCKKTKTSYVFTIWLKVKSKKGE